MTSKLVVNIVLFASYSFNKSHAAAYALISYRTAYLKHYYKLEFFTALISSSTKDPEELLSIVKVKVLTFPGPIVLVLKDKLKDGWA